jgi:hypothetical protein
MEDDEEVFKTSFFNKRLHLRLCSLVAAPVFLAELGGEGERGKGGDC